MGRNLNVENKKKHIINENYHSVNILFIYVIATGFFVSKHNFI